MTTIITPQPLGQPGQAPLVDQYGRPTPQFAQWLAYMDQLATKLNSVGSAPFALLNTLTPAAVANIADTTSITSAYDEYMIVLRNIVPATANSKLVCRFSQDVGVSYKTSGYLSLIAGGFGAGTAGVGSGNSAELTGIGLSDNNVALDGQGTTANYGLSGTIFLHGPNSANRKTMTGSVTYLASAAVRFDTVSIGGAYDGVSPNAVVNALQFTFLAGNITSGSIKIYGIPT